MCCEGGMLGLPMFIASVVRYCLLRHQAMGTHLDSIDLGRHFMR